MLKYTKAIILTACAVFGVMVLCVYFLVDQLIGGGRIETLKRVE